jgi:hypothetical protein
MVELRKAGGQTEVEALEMGPLTTHPGADLAL